MPKPKAPPTPTIPQTPSLPPSLPPSLTSPLPLPSLIVFDLDYTLWPFWVDTHASPPLKPLPSSTTPPYTIAARDKHGEEFAFYPHVPALLAALDAHPRVRVAAASRTGAPEVARDLLRMLQVPWFDVPSPAPVEMSADDASSAGSMSKKAREKERAREKAAGKDKGGQGKARRAIEFFSHMEIYPGSKKRHFAKLREATGVEFGEMLFFDDEKRNREVEELGVTMWWVPDGLDGGEFERGVGEWRRRRGL
ncbi:hypothetical protein VE03_05462 [Pseudogymnoascus sp. 23342-1-I1]|nr:hypothetical protein VE03_05462 [Pseudogymnoascus sp. 23342-1-I1]